MAFTTTTLTSAVTVNETSIAIAAATGFAAGQYIKIDQEIMRAVQSYAAGGLRITVQRGVEGTATQAHKSGANVVTGLATDFAGPVPQVITPYPLQRAREIRSYSANGAITLPTPGNDMVAILNGTSTLTAMTVANPTKDMDGDVLTIIANGKAAHVVDFPASGLGNGGANVDKATFDTGGLAALQLMACNGFWVLAVASGTLTANDVAMT